MGDERAMLHCNNRASKAQNLHQGEPLRVSTYERFYAQATADSGAPQDWPKPAPLKGQASAIANKQDGNVDQKRTCP